MNSWTSWKEVVGTSLQDGWAFSPSKSKGAKCPTDITLKVSRENSLKPCWDKTDCPASRVGLSLVIHQFSETELV